LDVGRKGLEELSFNIHLPFTFTVWAANSLKLLFDGLYGVMIEARLTKIILMITIYKENIMIKNNDIFTYFAVI
jgi:hypothetical protein